MGARVAQHPWGMVVMVTGAILVGLVLLATSAALFALAIFLVRRSRVGPSPPLPSSAVSAAQPQTASAPPP